MAEQTVTPFQFDGERRLRTVIRDGAPWFVANDVCAILGIADARQALDKLDDDERGGCSVPTPSGDQTMRVVSESGLYALVLRSRDAMTPGTVAHRFRKWVTAEVLPAIRRTGSYDVAEAAPALPPPSARCGRQDGPALHRVERVLEHYRSAPGVLRRSEVVAVGVVIVAVEEALGLPPSEAHRALLDELGGIPRRFW